MAKFKDGIIGFSPSIPSTTVQEDIVKLKSLVNMYSSFINVLESSIISLQKKVNIDKI